MSPVPGREPLEVVALGRRVRLEVDDEELRTALHRLLRDLAPREGLEAASPAAPLVLRCTGRGPWVPPAVEAGRGPVRDRRTALARTLAAVNEVATLGARALAVHAAVVADGARTVVLAAPSGTGKSTLTAALLRRGWAYGSDEAFALRWRDGVPVAYPRPLALSAWSAEQLAVSGVPSEQDEHLFRAADLGAEVAGRLRPPSDVVLLEQPGAVPSLRPCHAQEAVAELLRRGFTVHADPPRALSLLASTCAAARCWRLRPGLPAATAAALARAVAA